MPRHFGVIAGRPVRQYSANDDLKHYRAPFRLRDYFRLRDLVWLAVVAVLIGVGL